MFTQVYAVFAQCLRNVCAMFALVLDTRSRLFTWVYAGLRNVYAVFAQCLRRVYAEFTQSLRRSSKVYACLRRFCAVFAQCRFTQVSQVYAGCSGLRRFMVYAFPHLTTSSRGAEAPTCPETSPSPTRSYAIAWFHHHYQEQSQPDHLDSTCRR
jgi:hypothetical protein